MRGGVITRTSNEGGGAASDGMLRSDRNLIKLAEMLVLPLGLIGLLGSGFVDTGFELCVCFLRIE